MGGVYLREEDCWQIKTSKASENSAQSLFFSFYPFPVFTASVNMLVWQKKNNTKAHAMVVTSTHVDNNSVSLCYLTGRSFVSEWLVAHVRAVD